jgi:hypothetical protein
MPIVQGDGGARSVELGADTPAATAFLDHR